MDDRPHAARAQQRFLHLIPDDKFIDEARALFEDARPGVHDYVVLGRGGPLRYIRTFEPCRVDPEQTPEQLLVAKLAGYEAVFVHFLTAQARRVIDKAPPATHFIWIGWGADYYHLIHTREHLLLPETRRELAVVRATGRRMAMARNVAVEIPRLALHPIRSVRRLRSVWRMRRIGAGRHGESRLLDRIDVFAPVLREDYDAVLASHPELRARFADWNYWTAGLAELGPPSVDPSSARNILLGNSATPENNHLEAMHLIASVDNPDRRIVCPLSYGDPGYGDMIAARGEELFGAGFIALRDYMDTAAYVTLLRSCSVVVMNHVRQQAMGNIILMLWLGARVFLNPESPVNRAMASIGIQVHDIRGLADFLRQDKPAASVDCILETRERLDRHFGRDAILEKTRRLLAQASGLGSFVGQAPQSGEMT